MLDAKLDFDAIDAVVYSLSPDAMVKVRVAPPRFRSPPPTESKMLDVVAAPSATTLPERIKTPHEELLTDIRLLTSSGQLISGADVYLYVTRRIWWAWPFYAIFSLPGFNRLIQVGYKWFARNRYCVSHTCKLEPRQ